VKLSPGTKLQRYEIKSLIGRGGMGEVYLADDSRLGRLVAVKVLNQSDDSEKLRRFRQEAKTISALSHPNILTLYEFGQHEDFHFIVSEYIKGETLREVLNKNKLTLDEILDIAVQIGNALAAAHESGIVHRDIKPENIMILPDGYVKVLDFGLAKLTNLEKMLQSSPDAPTASVIHTQSGLIMGTINYMSPEQLRGQPVDERADIWSLGVVLFEMLTGQQPFTGASVSDTIAAILNQPPPAMTGIPPQIEAVAGKALEKQKEDRLQTARELVSALKNLKNYFLSRSDFAFDGAASQFIAAQSSPPNKNQSVAIKNYSELISKQPKKNFLILFAAIGFLVAGIFGLFFLFPTIFQEAPTQIKTTRLTTGGNATTAAISPDGRVIAYVQTDGGKHSLYVRQTGESAANEIIPPGASGFNNLTFSPDGNWIYYTKFEGSSSGTLYRTPYMRGSQQEVLKDIDSAISFSPDGREFAFIRSKPDVGIDRIIISDVNGANQRVLTEKVAPEFFIKNVRESLAWSPDGNSIACPLGKLSSQGDSMGVIEINIETREEKPLTARKWARVGRVVWTKDIDKLLITAVDFGSNLYQIVKVSRADGKTQNLTSEISDYFNISLSKDSNQLLATIYDKNSSISTASFAQINQLKQITGVSYEGIGGAVWTAGGKIVFVSMESGNEDIWVMNADGTSRQQLTFDKAVDECPVISKDGRYIVFVSSRNGVAHVWQMNFSGGELKQLTDKGGESFPQITADGKYVIFSARIDGRPTLWKAPLEGGEQVRLTEEMSHWASISPDGKTVACLTRGTAHTDRFKLSVVSTETGSFLKTFEFFGDASPTLPPLLRWLPDGQAIAYIATKNGVSNILAQAVAGGEPKKLTDFSADRIFSFDFSSDGKSVVFARGVMRNNLVLIENF
jgi:serine/threonine protein kinase/Tol biopolymer transport system component